MIYHDDCAPSACPNYRSVLYRKLRAEAVRAVNVAFPIPALYAKASLFSPPEDAPPSTFYKDLYRKCKQYVRLVLDGGADLSPVFPLVGSCGCGKTHLACAIGNMVKEAGLSVAFLHWGDFLRELQDTFDDRDHASFRDTFGMAANADLAILDDFDKCTETAWRISQAYDFLNLRYAHRRPTVITTATHPKEIDIGRDYKAAVADRMRDTQATITFPPRSLRGLD